MGVGLEEPWLDRRRVAARFRASLNRLMVLRTFLDLEVLESATIALVRVLVVDGLLALDILVLIRPDLWLPPLFFGMVVEDEVLNVGGDGIGKEAPLTAKPGANGFTHPSADSVALGLGTMVTRDVLGLTPSVGPDFLLVEAG